MIFFNRRTLILSEGYIVRIRRLGLTTFLGLAVLLSSAGMYGAPITADLSDVKPGPIAVTATGTELTVAWRDGSDHRWKAVFALESKLPLITSISSDGKVIVDRAVPFYRLSTGVRTGGWDAFFDFPPMRPQGTRTFMQTFHPTAVKATTVGDRVEVSFDGFEMGIFSGSMRYDFYPQSSLIQQVALLTTNEKDVAYTYDAGMMMISEADRRPGLNMASNIMYYDADGQLRSITSPYGSERHTLRVHYRAVAAKMGAGSIVAFPAPHRYLFARDYTTNMGYAWYSAWRGKVGLGIQQCSDDNTLIYPWINAPPGTQQEMGIFFLLGADPPQEALDHVLAYTHKDVYPHLDGYITFAPHWHFAYTEQAVANGPKWRPPFKTALEKIGVDAAMIMDFHIDGHPQDLTKLRLRELSQYYNACRNMSDSKFLLIPAEEADVYLGGHWSVTFPKQVYWMMDRLPGEPFVSPDAKYGKVYRVHDVQDMWKLVKEEHGYAYQTHPRTKGSTGYPDKIKDTFYFRDPLYFGVGWKGMPSDLSIPELGARSFKTLDDMNNLGLHKALMGEVDVFQLSADDELYAHMNVNYVHINKLPDFDHYSYVLDAAAHGEDFISTGEVLLKKSVITGKADTVHVSVETSSTFPLRVAEVVWGDGTSTHHERFDLYTTHQFENGSFVWDVKATAWKWARVGIWDVAGDGAFTNPTWSDSTASLSNPGSLAVQ